MLTHPEKSEKDLKDFFQIIMMDQLYQWLRLAASLNPSLLAITFVVSSHSDYSLGHESSSRMFINMMQAES